ncbi:MAG TPA: hypothetical protein VGQ00_03305 [Candidatus Norongarragalinales archaeon]|jgi:tRNA threonylcarbamoyladenosine modification (KEOPS) complex Cgi121 subunit|nr:hypothetical protein [Candidatus Norongarragalinales archaeon]
MNVYFVETERNVTEVVAVLKKQRVEPFIVLRPELACFDALLDYSLFLAYKAFQLGKQRARDLSIQWLLYLAATQHVDKALQFTTPNGRVFAIASDKKIDAKTLKQIGKEKAFTCPAHAKKEIAKHYGVTGKALERYAPEELIREKIAIASMA